MQNRSDAAARSHWHTYVVRFFFTGSPDQDDLSDCIERRFSELHGRELNDLIDAPDTSDESLAAWFIKQMSGYTNADCVKVILTNDGQRGAEITK